MQPITVAQYGLGPIGVEILKLILSKPWLRLVAAVDIDPAKIGRDVSELIGRNEPTGITISQKLEVKADVVCHSTGSRLRDVQGQLVDLLSRGSHVVSTCEELSFPLDAEARETLQKTARSANVTLLGTGVNPGFVMDKLPLTLSAVCQSVSAIRVNRVVDASRRREPLQRKVGAGMTPEEFASNVKAGKIKHMGLRESLMMIANGLGVELDEVSEEVIKPVMAREKIKTQFLTVEAGQVAGVHQTISGRKGGQLDLALDIQMYVGASEAGDRIEIKGVP
ncbi:MAG TPA: dihydrodipicolinate reductase, partial [Thermoanaerobaculia bacterium]|nr:dihydrodipicolinate reductase [Thermoanaerobaculia bacterium]